MTDRLSHDEIEKLVASCRVHGASLSTWDAQAIIAEILIELRQLRCAVDAIRSDLADRQQ